MILALWLAPGPDLLAKTWHSQPESNRIQAGFAQYDLGSLWNNATESESGKLVAGCLYSARTRPDDSCTLACFRTRCTWPKPGQAIQIGSGLVLYNMTRAFKNKQNKNKPELNQMREARSGTYNPAWFWPHAGHNGHKQNASGLDPVCLLGIYSFGNKTKLQWQQVDYKHNLLCKKPTKPTSVKRPGNTWLLLLLCTL